MHHIHPRPEVKTHFEQTSMHHVRFVSFWVLGRQTQYRELIPTWCCYFVAGDTKSFNT